MQETTKWQQELELIASILDKAPLDKSTKWGADVYSFDGRNVVSYGGFKHYFALWFFNGVFLSDPLKVLINASEGKTKSLRQWRFTSASELNEKEILNYVHEAIEVEKKGLRIKPEATIIPAMPLVMTQFLIENPELRKKFEMLSPGKRKEYILHIKEAKQETTQEKRLQKISSSIAQGMGLHDKYKK